MAQDAARAKPIYLDHNATTPVHPAVLEAMVLAMREGPGNPSSLHGFGEAARRRLDRARAQVAALIGARPDEVVFTSGGTESDNHALLGVVEAAGGRGHVITSAVEHQAVLATCLRLEAHGVRVSYLPVDGEGRVDPASVEAALASDTVLVSVMLANNDVGTLQPLADIVARAHARGVPVHSDAVQAVGKVPVDVAELGVDLLSLSAHKIHGPQGAGALYVRHGVAVAPLLTGGHQERRRRAGTEAVPALVGLGQACELAFHELAGRAAHVRVLRDRLEEGLLARVPGVRIHGRGAPRVPNTVNAGFPGLSGDLLVMNLDVLGVAASTGSACAEDAHQPSPVLLAMGLAPAEARCAVRFSLGADNTRDEIDRTVLLVADLVAGMKGAPGA